MRNTTININKDKHHAVRVYCVTAGIGLGEFVELAVAEKMEREPLE